MLFLCYISMTKFIFIMMSEHNMSMGEFRIK